MIDKTVKERLASLEEKVVRIREDLTELRTSFKEFRIYCYAKFDTINPKLSGRDKTTVIVSVLSSITAVIVAFISLFR